MIIPGLLFYNWLLTGWLGINPKDLEQNSIIVDKNTLAKLNEYLISNHFDEVFEGITFSNIPNLVPLTENYVADSEEATVKWKEIT